MQDLLNVKKLFISIIKKGKVKKKKDLRYVEKPIARFINY